MNHNKVAIALVVALIAGFCAGCGSSSKRASEEKDWVEATGVATIRDSNHGLAKDEALRDAKRQAVEQVFGSIISARTDVQNFELVRKSITSKTEGLVESYTVLSSGAVSDKEYQVRIRAKVSQVVLERAIEEALASRGKPRVMVLLSETFDGKEDTAKIAQTELEAQLVAQGFPMVDQAMVERVLARNRSKIAAALKNNNPAARELGIDAGAEVIIVGSSQVQQAGKIADSQLISLQAVVNLRVIDVNTGEILTAGQEQAAYPHLDPMSGRLFAIKRAVTPLREKLVNGIVRQWESNRAETIALLVTGLDYEALMGFRNELLEKVRGVQAVNPKGSAGKAARLDVEFQGTSFELADRLVNSGITFKLKVEEVKPNSLQLSAKPN
ncbi:MAG: flagellar assembly protein T N-terminal domain-containing protein [Turneriella sp.]|nr:flagellar assembly protein T N-terminal domain-containing protein [Turneriella sp.]